MNLLLFPMWLLSGAVFPPSGASTWVEWIMKVNPLAYQVAAVRHIFYRGGPYLEAELPSFATALLVSAAFGAAVFAAAFLIVRADSSSHQPV